MSGVVLVPATSLAMLALLAFAVSVVGSLSQTSRHRPTRGSSVAAGASLALLLEKVDPYGRHLAYVYLPEGEILDYSSDARGRLPVEIRRWEATTHVRELAATCVLATQASCEARLNGRKLRTDGRREA